MGRKSKLTPELTEEVYKLLRQGVTDKAAYNHVGIAEPTFYQWLDIGNACIEGKDHDRKPKSRETQKKFIEFVETVTRARGEAMVSATLALRHGMMPHDVKSRSVDTFSETRLNQEGEEYTYTQTRIKETITHHPADWRAAVEYLKRRDRNEWSDRREVTGADGGEIVFNVVYKDND